MKSIGTVVAVLNDEYLLVKTNVSLKPGEVLVAFEIVVSDKVKTVTGLSEIHFPKGKLLVVSNQDHETYLVSTTQRSVVTKTIFKDDFLLGVAGATSLAASALFGKPERVVQSVPEKVHAAVDLSQSLGLEFNQKITVGDQILREGAL